MELLLKGKVALITGAAQGIGRQIALTFAQAGAKVAICDVNLEAAQKTEQELKAFTNHTVSLKADVTDFKAIENLVNIILDKFTKIDILVNNAGITKDNLLLRLTDSDWDAVLNVNLKGAFNLTKAVSKVMVRQHSGKIINIASIIGIIGNAGQANYAASKAGIIALTKTAARELASRNINVNAVAPGFISTAMTDKLSDAVKEKILAQIPLGKLGRPQDVAEACLFLASDLANYITGQTIVVDGGMVMV